jgi:hypothetical protein
MITPILMNVDPQSPTTDSSTLPIDGCLAVARSACGSTPYETSVTDAKTASTLRNPRIVARPTSARRRAKREYTLAPSIPRNTNVVTSIVSLTWSNTARTDRPSLPQKLSANVPASNATATMTMKVRIGTSFAMVTIRLTTVACRTPRAIRKWNSQTPAEDRATARIVLPCPRKKVPRVVIVKTMKKTLPATLLAQ